MKRAWFLSVTLHALLISYCCIPLYHHISVGNISTVIPVTLVSAPLHSTATSHLRKPEARAARRNIKSVPIKQIASKNISGQHQALALYLHDAYRTALLQALPEDMLEGAQGLSLYLTVTPDGAISHIQLYHPTGITTIDHAAIDTAQHLSIPRQYWPKHSTTFSIPVLVRD